MVRPHFEATLDHPRGAINEFEERIQRPRGRLKVLEGRPLCARGATRVELGRLEHGAARRVGRAERVLEDSRGRLGRVVTSGRRQTDAVMRSVASRLERSLRRARKLGSTAGRLPIALRAACAPAARPWVGSAEPATRPWHRPDNGQCVMPSGGAD
jgi:hypothetical protein